MSDKKYLEILDRQLRLLEDAGLGPQHSIGNLTILLHVAKHPGKSVREIAKATGLGVATTADTLLRLGVRPAARVKPVGLVDWSEAPDSAAKKCQYLTAKGQRLLTQMEEAITGASKEGGRSAKRTP